MATGHILPGYGNPVSNCRRVHSAGGYPLDSSTLLDMKNAAKANSRELASIREGAKSAWLRNTTQPTSYDSHFSRGEVTDLTHTTPRPTSSHRHNNPHPPQVFLTNRLHYIEGYHNADARVGKSAYQIDASQSKSVQDRRRAPRDKYVARPVSSILNVYKEPFGFKNEMPPREAQAAEAWCKLANEEDHEKVYEVIKMQSNILEDDYGCRPKTAYPSLHRWMKLSGSNEYDATTRIMNTLQSNSLRPSMGQKARQDIRSAGSYRFTPRLRRGEYSMHPDWPTSLPHHRVP